MPKSLCRLLAPVLIACLIASPLAAQQPAAPPEPSTAPSEFGLAVRSTDARTPEQELAGFHLPTGYVAELIASEPTIAKPLNMAFDWQGRLWVTSTVQYPHPYDSANDSSGTGPRDSIVVLEDRDHNGSFEASTIFADDLNIPIGVLPYGEGCIVFSIPNLLYLRDTDGDGKADRRDVLYGPFDTTRDTHGMVNSLRWMPDGWVMANHGFNNRSRVAGTDGHVAEMESGNVFRFRPDGSRIEVFAHGQVNPFGMTVDGCGNVFTADCHSKPISQIIEGGWYPSFGRQHDGLGFISPVMDHTHGSTAISGVATLDGSSLQGLGESQIVSGNVMTSRINRNRLVNSGYTYRAQELPDLLTSDDPWFRPVDIRVGPDGNIYVADFYNKIIGHYEVPLDHPDRDRTSGRIWRIRPLDQQPAGIDLKEISSCVTAADSTNPAMRQLALQRYEELRLQGQSKLDSLPISSPGAAWLNAIDRRIDGIDTWQWAAETHEKLLDSSDEIATAFWQATHAALESDGGRQTPLPTPAAQQVLRSAEETLTDHRQSPHAAAAASRLVLLYGDAAAVGRTLKQLPNLISKDPMLAAAMRIAARERFERSSDLLPGVLATLEGHPAADATYDILAATSPSPSVSAALLSRSNRQPIWLLENFDAVLARIPLESLGELAQLRSSAAVSPERLIGDLGQIVDRFPQGSLPDDIVAIAQAAIDAGLASNAVTESRLGWYSATAGQALDNTQVLLAAIGPWPQQTRNTTAGEQLAVYSSFPLGEPYQGRMVSDAFEPASSNFSFWLCGHNGQPDQTDRRVNRVELVDASSFEVLYTAHPPRNDTAVKIEWDVAKFAGRPLRLIATDEDAGSAYAWLAFGGFSDRRLEIQPVNAAADAFTLLSKLRRHGAAVKYALTDRMSPADRRIASLVEDPAQTDTVIDVWSLVRGLPSSQGSATAGRLKTVAGQITPHQQQELVKLLSEYRSRWPTLLTAVEEGWLPATSLAAVDNARFAVAQGDEVSEALDRYRQASGVDLDLAAFTLRVQAVQDVLGQSERGAQIFEKQCAACHKVGSIGQVVGPQLDGVGGRGIARLCEDILLPNLHVDRAFEMQSILLDSGQILSGLIADESDDSLTVVATNGTRQTVNVDEIEGIKKTGRSLMPDNFGTQLDDQTLADLIAYLRQQAAPVLPVVSQ